MNIRWYRLQPQFYVRSLNNISWLRSRDFSLLNIQVDFKSHANWTYVNAEHTSVGYIVASAKMLLQMKTFYLQIVH